MFCTEHSDYTEALSKIIKLIMKRSSVFAWALIFLLFVSCDSTESKNAFQDNTEEGTIYISVDESFKPVIEEQIKVHQSSFPKANIVVSYKSEADCFRDLQKDSTRMIIVARGLDEKEAEFYKSALSYKPQYAELAYDAVALIVNNLDTLKA